MSFNLGRLSDSSVEKLKLASLIKILAYYLYDGAFSLAIISMISAPLGIPYFYVRIRRGGISVGAELTQRPGTF